MFIPMKWIKNKTILQKCSDNLCSFFGRSAQLLFPGYGSYTTNFLVSVFPDDFTNGIFFSQLW